MGNKILGERGEALIKGSETLALVAYHGAADPPDVWTIGYGHTKTAKPGMTIPVEEAERLFDMDTADPVRVVNESAVGPMTQGQFDAMVSLAYNIGCSAFKKSAVLRLHNMDWDFAAAAAFLLWNKSGGKRRRGLLIRRLKEALLYCADAWTNGTGE